MQLILNFELVALVKLYRENFLNFLLSNIRGYL